MTDTKARIRYMAEQQALKNAMTPAQVRAASNPAPAPAPATPDLETLIRQKLENNTLSISDALAAKQAGNNALSMAINRKLAGFPWEYTWANANPTPAPAPNPTTTPGPQVIWYDPAVWKNNPTSAYLNNTGGQSINKFSSLGKFGSYDPATETTIQSPETMNAFNMMEIDRDPVRRDFMESLYDRHGRNWEKEREDAIRMAPMGNASTYVRNG